MGSSPTKALASTGGANTVTTTGNVNANTGNRSISQPTMGSHNHPLNAQVSPGNPCTVTTAPNTQGYNSGNKGGNGGHNHPASANFSGSARSVLQPYLTLIYIIKT